MDVWFDSGCTHAFTVEGRDDLKPTRRFDGGKDVVMYLEGSDQHRGWFHSSLLESCGTRGHAPYVVVATHVVSSWIKMASENVKVKRQCGCAARCD